jgi:hypothetical protein
MSNRGPVLHSPQGKAVGATLSVKNPVTKSEPLSLYSKRHRKRESVAPFQIPNR